MVIPAVACATTSKPAAVDADISPLARAAAPADDKEPMLPRIEDEDTRDVDLPHFGECPYDPEDIRLGWAPLPP